MLLGYLAARLTPGLERVEGARYRRRVGSDVLTVSLAPGGDALWLHGPHDAAARARVAALFDVGADLDAPAAALGRDPLLRARIARAPGLRPLGAWSPFELCVRTIVGQQVTVAAAGTLMGRLVERCGGALAPDALAGTDLGGVGMPGRRVATVAALARAVAEGRLDLTAPWAEIHAGLRAIPGVGPWTRDYLAIRLGRDPDALPAGDLGLQRAAGVASERALLARAEPWRPFRALAATYLWVVSASS